MNRPNNFSTLFLWNLRDYILRKKIAIIFVLVLLVVITLGEISEITQFLEKSNQHASWDLFVETIFYVRDLYSSIFFFMFFTVPVFVSISLARDFESGVTTTIISLPVTRRAYFFSKIISEIFVLFLVFLTPPYIAYFYLGYNYSIWLPKAFVLLSLCLSILLLISYFVSLLWAVLQSHSIGSALSGIITLQMWLSLDTLAESIRLVFHNFTYNHLFLYSFTPSAIIYYLFDYLDKYPFSSFTSEIWLSNYYWVVTNTVITATSVIILTSTISYYLFLHKDF